VAAEKRMNAMDGHLRIEKGPRNCDQIPFLRYVHE
jgi:hypothetical protein